MVLGNFGMDRLANGYGAKFPIQEVPDSTPQSESKIN